MTLQWTKVGDTWFAGDGRYTVSLERAGWIARAFRDSKLIYESKPASVDRYAKEHCEAFAAGLAKDAMDDTAEHVAFPDVAYEVTTDDREPIQPGDYGYYRTPGAVDQ